MSDEKPVKKITAGLVFSWIFSVLFMVGGFGMLFEPHVTSAFGAICTILLGIVLFPPFNQWLKTQFKVELSTGLKVVLIIVLIVLAAVSMKDNSPAQPAATLTPTPSNTATDSPVATDPIAAIPAQQPESAVRLYTDDDVTTAIALAKSMSDKIDEKAAFMANYRVQQDGITLTLFTPFATAVSIVVANIEKYDPYTQTDVRNVMEQNIITAFANDVPVKEMYYSWDTSKARAVIEYDDKVCRGTVSKLDTEIIDLGSDYPFATTVTASFPCFSEIRNKNVRFVYVLDSQKTSFDVDMTKYK